MIRTFHILLLAGCLCLTACQSDLHFVPDSFRSATAEITGDETGVSMVFPSDAGVATLSFETNRAWTAVFVNDRAREWCSLPAESGKKGSSTLTVNVLANDGYDERSASILLRCEDVQRTVVVTQKQRDALLLSPGRVELPQAGGGFTIEVRSNIDYSVTIPSAYSWLHAVGTKGLVATTRTFQVDANPDVEPRQGFVTVTSSLGEEVVAVYQTGEEPALVISETAVDMPGDGGSFDVQVTSNLDVEIASIPDPCDWVGEIQTKTLSTNTYCFSVAPNAGCGDREMELVFFNRPYGLSDTVHVRQGFQRILLSEASVDLPSREVDFTVLLDGIEVEEYQVTLSHRWLWMGDREPGDGFTRLRLHAQENDASVFREGLVLLERKGVQRVDTVSVKQCGRLPGFWFSTAVREVKAPMLDEHAKDAWILWGDGSFERYAADLVHSYAEPGRHTVWVEGRWIVPIQITEPEDGMKIDFSGLTEGDRR